MACNNWTMLPMPHEVILTVHRLAAACKNTKASFFIDKNGNIINDNTPEHENSEITGVDYNSPNYNSPDNPEAPETTGVGENYSLSDTNYTVDYGLYHHNNAANDKGIQYDDEANSSENRQYGYTEDSTRVNKHDEEHMEQESEEAIPEMDEGVIQESDMPKDDEDII